MLGINLTSSNSLLILSCRQNLMVPTQVILYYFLSTWRTKPPTRVVNF